MLGVGTDIVETRDIVRRMARSESFAGFVFSDAERRQGESLSVPERSYAAKFAAKEAFLAGDQYAYIAGILAVLLGAALVFFKFPRPDDERKLLLQYQSENLASPVDAAASTGT